MELLEIACAHVPRSRVHLAHPTAAAVPVTILLDGPHRLGVNGPKLLEQLKAPFIFYHGDSNQRERFSDFSNPKEAWRGLFAVITTTVMSIGIDVPQDIKVARVHAYFSRMGCSFQQLCQALLRARRVQNTEINV